MFSSDPDAGYIRDLIAQNINKDRSYTGEEIVLNCPIPYKLRVGRRMLMGMISELMTSDEKVVCIPVSKISVAGENIIITVPEEK